MQKQSLKNKKTKIQKTDNRGEPLSPMSWMDTEHRSKSSRKDDVLSFGQIVGITLHHPLLEYLYTIFSAEKIQE